MSQWMIAALLGFFTTSSTVIGAAIGLYIPIPKRLLACILAFATGALINALAIELAFEGARDLHEHGFSANLAWLYISGGFALGATIYYCISLYLESKGAALRNPALFREYVLKHKKLEIKEKIDLLSNCDLLRHLPPEEIENLLPSLRSRHMNPGEILFRAGDEGDALYIIAKGTVEALDNSKQIAELGRGQAFGEMALLSQGPRTATIRAVTECELLQINKKEFEQLLAEDRLLAKAVKRLSHKRAIENLSEGGANPATWSRIASNNIERLSQTEENKILAKTGRGAGLAIVIGNMLDSIPACLVIGSRFTGLENISLTLMMGLFLGGLPEAAASASLLSKAGFSDKAIFGLWWAVVIAGIAAAVAGKLFIGSSEWLVAIFAEAIAGGAVLALVVHAMIPEAIHEGRSLIVLPTVAGFLVALFLALSQKFV